MDHSTHNKYTLADIFEFAPLLLNVLGPFKYRRLEELTLEHDELTNALDFDHKWYNLVEVFGSAGDHVAEWIDFNRAEVTLLTEGSEQSELDLLEVCRQMAPLVDEVALATSHSR